MAESDVLKRLKTLEESVRKVVSSLERLELGGVITREPGFQPQGELTQHVERLVGVIDDWRSQAQRRAEEESEGSEERFPAVAQLRRIASALESRADDGSGDVIPEDDPRREVWENVARLAQLLDRPEDTRVSRTGVRTVPIEPGLRKLDPIRSIVAWPGGDVSFYGTDLHAVSEVLVDQTTAELIRRAPDEIRFVVPEDATAGQVEVYIQGGEKLGGFELEIRTGKDFEEASS